MERLEEDAASLQHLSFKHPKAFVNALLSDRDITSLIRDAETHEQALFTCPPTSDKGAPVATKQGLTKMRLQIRREATALLGISRVSQAGNTTAAQSTDEAGLSALLACVEKLLLLYPAQGVQAQVDMMRHKYARLTESIAALEDDFVWQQKELDSQHQARDQERLPEPIVGHITEDMIRQEEEEVRALEAQIQGQ
jgi:hypothetical protein